MRKSNSKLNFTKNRWASLFPCGRLKISNSPDLASAQKVRLHHWRYFGYLSYQYSRKLKSFPIFSWKRWYHILRIIRVMQLNHWNLWSVFFLKNLKTTDYLGSITNMTNQKSRLLKKVSYSVSKIAKWKSNLNLF